MLLYGMLGLCALLAAGLVYRHDMFDREPIHALALMAAAGSAAMAGLSVLEDRVIFLPTHNPDPWWIAAVAATHEEGAKLLLVLLFAILFPKIFNDPMDGIVYGSMAGLGMAVYESVLAVRRLPSPAGMLPAQELVRIFGHLVLGGIGGFAVGMLRTGIPRARPTLLGCIGFAVGIHFLVDWITLTEATEAAFPLAKGLLVAAFMLAGILLYGALTFLAVEWSRERFAPLSAQSIFGWPFTRLWRSGPRR